MSKTWLVEMHAQRRSARFPRKYARDFADQVAKNQAWKGPARPLLLSSDCDALAARRGFCRQGRFHASEVGSMSTWSTSRERFLMRWFRLRNTRFVCSRATEILRFSICPWAFLEERSSTIIYPPSENSRARFKKSMRPERSMGPESAESCAKDAREGPAAF